MLDFSSWLNLPLIWGILLASAIFLYAILDGFDLGCGILFPFAKQNKERNQIMQSIAPFWDANETWLILGGGGLFAAFPLAYSILMPALYLPVIFMLIGLIFRGIAFEFRFKTHPKQRYLWDWAFHIGSLIATFMQGIILGNFVQGLPVINQAFSGSALHWLNGFSSLVGLGLIFGYALIGACWLILKTSHATQQWAYRMARYAFLGVCFAIVAISIILPLINKTIYQIWLSPPIQYGLITLAGLILAVFTWLWHTLNKQCSHLRAFLLTSLLFLLAYLSLGLTLYPWVVPFHLTLSDAAATSTSQSFLLLGTVFLLPIVLSYTAYSYYVFRGKTLYEQPY